MKVPASYIFIILVFAMALTAIIYSHDREQTYTGSSKYIPYCSPEPSNSKSCYGNGGWCFGKNFKTGRHFYGKCKVNSLGVTYCCTVPPEEEKTVHREDCGWPIDPRSCFSHNSCMKTGREGRKHYADCVLDKKNGLTYCCGTNF